MMMLSYVFFLESTFERESIVQCYRWGSISENVENTSPFFHEMKTKCHVNEFREKGNSIEKLTNYEQLRSELQKSDRGPYKSGGRQSLYPTSRNEFFW